MLLVTQNIGSFDCGDSKTVPEAVRQHTVTWVKALARFIQSAGDRQDGPVDLVVLHLQEIGGKKFHGAFNEYLATMVAQCHPSAAWCSGLLMPVVDDEHSFTAMGAVLWCSARLLPLTSLLSVRHRTYMAAADNPTAAVGPTALFHGGKFCNAEKSRKGFLLTSLRVGSQILNFVNLHLFHDADNASAVSASPSTYVARRREALVEAVSEIQPLVSPSDPLFLFGDMNMRLDGKKLVEFLEAKFSAKVEMGKKEVKAPRPVMDYLNTPLLHLDELLSFDAEGKGAAQGVADATGIQIAELPRRFPPTYLYSDNIHEVAGRRAYKLERLPAWCDRIMFNPAAMVLMATQRKENSSTADPSCTAMYDSTTLELLDHEAVFLSFTTRLL